MFCDTPQVSAIDGDAFLIGGVYFKETRPKDYGWLFYVRDVCWKQIVFMSLSFVQ